MMPQAMVAAVEPEAWVAAAQRATEETAEL